MQKRTRHHDWQSIDIAWYAASQAGEEDEQAMTTTGKTTPAREKMHAVQSKTEDNPLYGFRRIYLSRMLEALRC